MPYDISDYWVYDFAKVGQQLSLPYSWRGVCRVQWDAGGARGRESGGGGERGGRRLRPEPTGCCTLLFTQGESFLHCGLPDFYRRTRWAFLAGCSATWVARH
jgi:hypothetical protein